MPPDSELGRQRRGRIDAFEFCGLIGTLSNNPSHNIRGWIVSLDFLLL
jgi:hypothetical protein